MNHPFVEMEPTIAAQLNRVQLLPNRVPRAKAIAAHLFTYKDRYAAVQNALGIPIVFTAAIHERESDANFDTYLGNGDPLSKASVHVPKGRGPFSNWQYGAIDALTLDRVNQVTDWTWERFIYETLVYNGFGPLAYGRQSGYPWSGTNIYDGGKFVYDGKWDPTVWDSQLGCYIIARELVEIDRSLDLPRTTASSAIDDTAPLLIGVGGVADQEHDTKWVQTALNALYISTPPLVVDGSYGRRTRAAIFTFQERANLDVDGVVGPKTIEELSNSLKMNGIALSNTQGAAS